MNENLKNNPIITGDKRITDNNNNNKKNPDKSYEGENPFISVDPKTGERIEVPTAAEDVENRLEISSKTGQPVESITAPPPERATEEEVKKREELIKKLSK